EARLAGISRVPDLTLVDTPSKRREPRIPFGQLVENGLLCPGDILFGPGKRWTAKVRADGSIISAHHRGSIHQVGAAVQGAPSCNGWTFWMTERAGKAIPIDLLRQQMRTELTAQG
ncbi:MAG: site-specific DNA-methyltransferase, partial [Alphaproteobacteria bacterium]